MKKTIFALFILAGLLLSTSLSSAETIYTRYFESIDGDLRSDILQVYSVTALRGEKITLVVYGLEEGMAPAITALDPTGITLVEDLNPNQEDVSLVQFDATVDGIYPFVVYRQTPVEGLVRIMLFEGDPIDATTSILDTVDPLLPSRAYLLAGERGEDDGEFSGQAIEFSVQSLPFENVAGVDDEDLPQPQFFASRATQQDTPELEERLAAVERSDWLNNANIQLYTLNIRPVPENPTGIQQEVFAEGDIEIPTLDQPLLPYDIVITVKPGIDPPIRLERPFCSGTLPLVGRTLIVQNVPGEAYTQLGTVSGGDIVEIIGTDDTGNYVQISWDAALNGSGWIPFQEVFETGSPECVRVIPVEEDMERLDEAIQEVIDEIRARFAPQEVAEVPTPTPQPTFEFTPQPVFSDVQLTNFVDNEFPVEGSTINFTIALGNFSTSLIENAQVDIILPIGLTYVGTSEHCLEGSVFPICILGDIPAGEVHGFLLYATVDPNTVGQTLTTIAETSSSGVLLQTPEDVTVVANDPTFGFATADLSTTKVVDDPTPLEQQTITFTITATNNGPDGAGDIALTDQLPAGLSYVGSSLTAGTYDPNTGVWYLGIMQAGETQTLTIQGSVNTGTYASTLTNTSSINAPNIIEPNTSNNTASLSIFVDCLAGGIPVAASDTTGLINAMNTANSNPDSTTICLTNSTYTLSAIDNNTNGDNGLPSVVTPITILGNAATIARSGTAPTFRIMHISVGGNLNLQDTTLTGGGGGISIGSGISNDGSATLTNSTVTGNVNTAACGGISNGGSGTLSLSASTVSNNSASNVGGICNSVGGTVTIDSSTISGNTANSGPGGGIYNLDTLIVTNSTITNNNALGGNGGGIITDLGTTFSINSSTVSGNTSTSDGGGIWSSAASATITNTTISGNTANVNGGGLSNNSGSVTITGGTISSNTTTTEDGGGIYNVATLVINGTALTGNTAESEGGALFNLGGNATITGANISGNTAGNGGGITNLIGATLSLNGVTVANNTAPFGAGGGIYNIINSTVSITGSIIGGSGTPNMAQIGGGGILNSSSSPAAVTITGSTVSYNTSSDGGGVWTSDGGVTINGGSVINNNSAGNSGGGIFNNSASATAVVVSGSTISFNTASGPPGTEGGGGIFTNSGTVTVSGSSTIAANQSINSNGGGIFNSGATISVSNSTISSNDAQIAGGGIFSLGTTTVNNSELLGNSANIGGGIRHSGGGNILNISGSTFSGNTASSDGGGLLNEASGTVNMINSTVSGNSSGAGGGGISNSGGGSTTNIDFSTIVYNSATTGGNIQNEVAATMTMKNSIVANNISGGDCNNLATLFDLADGFDTDGSCQPGGNWTTVTSANLNLNITLAYNGGPTQTHALISPSVAIDAAVDCTDIGGSPVGFDQRGVPRPQGIDCDSGAYEFP